ncbi:hypothetical protein M427DRAFT_138100 [Gonapodya prolifera JEL478]|uniref:Uncharacterized protein n=1 Tax=Gonapodya prolifera (strain JEL478) TaxID=1344416 RepID=A0A139A4D7_GONPJ|nr:hypothetical protein M427DRAFT_138100 [Gonapodya prolifera JEL478]|eukprot:KXS11662.1 hypothetical protein M427DRAFT_138100 [Gonapodya prolifera JEL478]
MKLRFGSNAQGWTSGTMQLPVIARDRSTVTMIDQGNGGTGDSDDIVALTIFCTNVGKLEVAPEPIINNDGDRMARSDAKVYINAPAMDGKGDEFYFHVNVTNIRKGFDQLPCRLTCTSWESKKCKALDLHHLNPIFNYVRIVGCFADNVNPQLEGARLTLSGYFRYIFSSLEKCHSTSGRRSFRERVTILRE